MLLNLFHKIEKETMQPHSFYDARIILALKLDKYTTNKENYRPIFLMIRDEKILIK
jgi:hypothetical protein